MHGTGRVLYNPEALLLSPAAPRKSYWRLSRRLQAQQFLLALFWPFLAAVVHVKTFPRYRLTFGFIAFCAFAGLAFSPWPGSDAHTYMLRLLAFRAGQVDLSGEPVPTMLLSFVGLLDLDARWYFAMVGLLYGFVVAAVARLLFTTTEENTRVTLIGSVFLVAFFMNHPVFSAINARFHLALWVLVLASLLLVNGQWKLGFATALFGSMIHFGQFPFVGMLGVFWATRRLGRWQLVLAYAILAVAFVVPPTLFVNIGDFLSQTLAPGALTSKVADHVVYAEKLAQFGTLVDRGEPSWFLQWFTDPVFWCLLISGHLLAWRFRGKRDDPLFQLWILIILSWALQYFMGGYVEGFSRVQRDTTALLLLFHAWWFLVRRDGALVSFIVNIGPILFYFVVAYRMWLVQVDIGAFMPIVFGIWPKFWPTVTEFLGFG